MNDEIDLHQLAQQIAQDENAQQSGAASQSSERAGTPPAPSAQVPAHPDLQTRAIAKEFRTAEQLAEMIFRDLRQVSGFPKAGVTVTVYGLSPWNSWLHFGAAAGAVRNQAELREFCAILTERLKSRYDILPERPSPP